MAKSKDELKKEAAEKAVEYVKTGMVLGLGTGSTVAYALEKIADLITIGRLKDIKGIPSSLETERKAKELGIPLTSFAEHSFIDLTIDGADEIDPELDLIKGGGGALTREKVLAQNSKILVIMADGSKRVERLGETFALPVEVLPFAADIERRFIESLGAEVTLRQKTSDSYFVTDNGNYILDCDFGIIDNKIDLAVDLESRAGIVEHGLFIALADEAVIATENGIELLGG